MWLMVWEGDTVIQNAANSSVGQCVTQIAKSRGINVINVVRGREQKELDALKQKMKAYGADNVITEEELVSPSFKEMFKSISQPKLAINLVGGSSATNIAKRLGYVWTRNLIISLNHVYTHSYTVVTKELWLLLVACPKNQFLCQQVQ